MTRTPDNAVRSPIDRHEAGFLRDRAGRPRIPSVSAEPGRAAEVRWSAEWPVARLGEVRLGEVRLGEVRVPIAEVWETDGLPAVFAEWPPGEERRLRMTMSYGVQGEAGVVDLAENGPRA